MLYLILITGNYTKNDSNWDTPLVILKQILHIHTEHHIVEHYQVIFSQQSLILTKKVFYNHICIIHHIS